MDSATSAPATWRLPGVAAQLGDRFGDVVEPVDVSLGQVAAVRIDRQPPPGAVCPSATKAGGLALGAKPVVLELHEHERGERVVQLGDVDVVRA